MDVILTPELVYIIRQYSYEILVTLILIFFYLIIRYKLLVSQSRTLRSFNKRSFDPAVPTDAPVDSYQNASFKKGLSGLEHRFSFMRKALPFIAIFLWLLMVFMPKLSEVPAAYLSIVAAVASVFAGLAFRPFLENLFAGVVISFFKSVKVGDTTIIEGEYGTIEEIGLTYSVLKKWDWVRIIIPNSILIQKEIRNLTHSDQFIWAHIEFFVAPEADLELVEHLAIEAAQTTDYLKSVEEPAFWVIELERDAVKCWLAVWVDSPSLGWDVRDQMRREVHKRLKENGILTHQSNWQNMNSR